MTRQETADLLVDQAAILIKKKIIAWLVSKIVFLAWGPFVPILAHFIGQLAEFVAKDAEMRIFFIYADLRTDTQGKTYLKAMSAYREAVNNGNTQNAKSLEIELNNAFRNLVMLSA